MRYDPVERPPPGYRPCRAPAPSEHPRTPHPRRCGAAGHHAALGPQHLRGQSRRARGIPGRLRPPPLYHRHARARRPPAAARGLGRRATPRPRAARRGGSRRPRRLPTVFPGGHRPGRRQPRRPATGRLPLAHGSPGGGVGPRGPAGPQRRGPGSLLRRGGARGAGGRPSARRLVVGGCIDRGSGPVHSPLGRVVEAGAAHALLAARDGLDVRLRGRRVSADRGARAARNAARGLHPAGGRGDAQRRGRGHNPGQPGLELRRAADRRDPHRPLHLPAAGGRSRRRRRAAGGTADAGTTGRRHGDSARLAAVSPPAPGQPGTRRVE